MQRLIGLTRLEKLLPGRRRKHRRMAALERDVGLIVESELFDTAWYLGQYPDVAKAGEDPILHYLRCGAAEMRDPGPKFSTKQYFDWNRDVALAGVNPLLHYIVCGQSEGRMTSIYGYARSLQLGSYDASIASSVAVNESSALIVCISSDASFPDLFSLRAPVALAPRVVVAHVRNEQEMTGLESILNRIAVDFDLIITQPIGRHSAEAPYTSDRCRKRAIVVFHDDVDPAQAFLHIVNSKVLFDYKKIFWIDDSLKASSDAVNRIIDFWSGPESDTPGLVSTSFFHPPKDQVVGIMNALTTFAAQIGRKRPALIDVCATGGIAMIAPLILQQLRSYQIDPVELSSEADSRWVLAALLTAICDEAGMSKTTLDAGSEKENPVAADQLSDASVIKSIAFYLPQFHPIPENDRWWGKGFTEWTNVTNARPIYKHHYQPYMPADLGFYDLRNPETQLAQAQLARENGIFGFCYYYYWFNGRKLLNRPIETMLESGAPDFPFCVCWANENWSRNWDGQDRHVLMEQSYSMESNRGLIRELISLMRDARYIRHNGKPVVLVYRIRIIPNWLETAKMWRDECRQAGIGEIHLCAVRFGLEPLDGDPSEFGLDSYVLFPPHESDRVDARDDVEELAPEFEGTMFCYDAVVDGDIARFSEGYPWPVHRGLMLGWDNTARRQRDARIFVGTSPARFRYWLKEVVVQDDRHNTQDESLIFINAWNEWAEGTTLEPSTRFGRGYLEAVRSVLGGRGPIVKGRTVEGVPSQEIRSQSDDERAPVLSFEGTKTHLPGAPNILVCAHVVSDKLFGGERSFIDMLDALAKLKLNVYVSIPSGNHISYTQLLQDRSLEVFVVPYRQWRNDRDVEEPVVKAFCDLINERRIDVVYANTIVLLEPLIAARRLNRRSVIHARELIVQDVELAEQIGLAPEDIIRRTFEYSDYIIANSRATEKAFYRNGVTFCAPNVVDPLALDLSGRKHKPIVFGIISSNLPKKGIADFVEVARLSEDLVPEARFLAIGPLNDHVERWKDNLPKNLTFAGYSESPQAAMAQVDVVLSLSHFAESFGRTVAEALAARRPVVAYDWGAVGELIEHGVTGFLAPYRDVEKVVEYVVQLCRNPHQVREMGEAGRQSILDHNVPVILRDNLWNAFQKILNRKLELRADEDRPVTIVVPIYNASEDVGRCLMSLASTVDVGRTRVLMIDDASTDPIISELLTKYAAYEGFHMLKNEKNVGYTGTINRGIRWAGDDDIVLLNSDTILVPGWMDGLKRAAFSQANVGTVTAMSDNAGAFSFPVFNQPNPKQDGISYDDHAAAILGCTAECEPVEVPTGSGFCLYIRRQVLKKVGLFDEALFPRGYGEENDFCMRVLEAGWKNLISPYAFVFHVRSASFGSEKVLLIKSAVDKVTHKYPDYAQRVKRAFSSAEMIALRKAAQEGLRSNEKSTDGGHQGETGRHVSNESLL